MKLQLIIYSILLSIIICSCTPDIEDDYLSINFSKYNQYQYFNSEQLQIVFAKAIYNAEISRNGVSIDSVTYSQNVLLKYNGITNHKYTKYDCKLSNDSNLYIVKCDTDLIDFRKILLGSSIIYSDTLFRIAFANPTQTDTILEFDSTQYVQILPMVNDSIANYIDSLNNLALNGRMRL